MKIVVDLLPSKGFASTIDMVDIQPLNYSQLMEYSKLVREGDELNDLIWDIEKLVQTIPNWDKLSSFDLYPIIAYKKMLSLDLKGEVSLSDGRKFSLSEVDFTDINTKILKISKIKIGNKEYSPSIKSMSDLYKCYVRCSNQGILNVKIATLACYLSAEPSDILDLKGSDITLCERLYPSLLSQPKVGKGGAEAVLLGKASDLFQTISRLLKVDDSKIQLSEEL